MSDEDGELMIQEGDVPVSADSSSRLNQPEGE